MAKDVKELHMGPRGLGRCEEMFMELTFMEDKLQKFLLQYRDLLPRAERTGLYSLKRKRGRASLIPRTTLTNSGCNLI